MLLIWLERYGIHFGTTKHVNVTVTNIIHIGRISSSAAEDSHIRWDWKRRFFLFFFFSFFVPKRQQQYCMSFEFMQSVSSNSTHSEQPWQISLNALLTPYPLRALAQTNTRTRKRKKKKTPLPFSPSSLILSPSFSSWLSLSGSARGGKRAHWSAKVSSHFTGRVCAALLSLNGNCSFHLAALPVADYWEAPAREGQKEGGSAGVRAPVRAWQAADKSSSCCSCMHLPLLLELCLSLSVFHTLIWTYT